MRSDNGNAVAKTGNAVADNGDAVPATGTQVHESAGLAQDNARPLPQWVTGLGNSRQHLPRWVDGAGIGWPLRVQKPQTHFMYVVSAVEMSLSLAAL